MLSTAMAILYFEYDQFTQGCGENIGSLKFSVHKEAFLFDWKRRLWVAVSDSGVIE